MIEILCRFDALKQAPVVFLSDTINGKQVQAWTEGGKPEYVPLDYYHMTSPLSAADEKVLMERFKSATNRQDQVVNIRHRLPRNMRPLPNLLANGGNGSKLKDVNPPPASAKSPQRKPGAMRIEDQALPEAPQGAPTPEEGLTPAVPIQAIVAAPVAPAADGLQSTAIWNKIVELNARLQNLTTARDELEAQLAAASTDLDVVKQATEQLIAEYNAAIEAEAAESLRKRQEMLAQLTAQVTSAPAPAPVAEAPADPAPVPAEPPAAQAPAAPKPNGNKAATKPPAKKSAAKSAPAKK